MWISKRNAEFFFVISKAPCKRTQHCWMLHVASVCTPCCMLLDVVACCCAKFETGQTFQPTTPNISFVPWSPKRSVTMLDLFAQLFQHCWGHARSLRTDYKNLWVVFCPRCTAGPKLWVVASVCTSLPRRTQQQSNNSATMLGVVAPVCTQPKATFTKTKMKQKFVDGFSLTDFSAAIDQYTIKSANFVSIEKFLSFLMQAQNWVNIEAMSKIWLSFCSGTSYCLEFSTTSNFHAAHENLPCLVALWNLSEIW